MKYFIKMVQNKEETQENMQANKGIRLKLQIQEKTLQQPHDG